MLLQRSVGLEKRPLSWVAGPQVVRKPPQLSMKAELRERRRRMTAFKTADGI